MIKHRLYGNYSFLLMRMSKIIGMCVSLESHFFFRQLGAEWRDGLQRLQERTNRVLLLSRFQATNCQSTFGKRRVVCIARRDPQVSREVSRDWLPVKMDGFWTAIQDHSGG